MIKKIIGLLILFIISGYLHAQHIMIPMDEQQKNHLKAYGLTYWVLENNGKANWLLNYRGGSFSMVYAREIETECIIRGISYEIVSNAEMTIIYNHIASPSVNMDKVGLEKAPKIAVYAPDEMLPWDDAVSLALTYAEIPYDKIYDAEVVAGKLGEYDWLHLHHEDFTGQYGKFYGAYRNAPWYIETVRKAEADALKLGFNKVSELKLFVAMQIKEYVMNGGFLFAMCSAPESIDIALAAHNTDICAPMFDGDPMDPDAQEKLDFSQTFAFSDFTISTNPFEYSFSNIDVPKTRPIKQEEDYFTLFEYSAKWDPVPTMLCQNHTAVIKGFMGQTTAFRREFIKPQTLIMGQNRRLEEARYIHGILGQGFWTFYGGHDPEDYRHFVGDPPTELHLYPNSPGYRLILNNVLFPAAKKQKQKT